MSQDMGHLDKICIMGLRPPTPWRRFPQSQALAFGYSSRILTAKRPEDGSSPARTRVRVSRDRALDL